MVSHQSTCIDKQWKTQHQLTSKLFWKNPKKTLQASEKIEEHQLT